MTLFCNEVLGFLTSFAIYLLRKRQLPILAFIVFLMPGGVCFVCLFFVVKGLVFNFDCSCSLSEKKMYGDRLLKVVIYFGDVKHIKDMLHVSICVSYMID